MIDHLTIVGSNVIALRARGNTEARMNEHLTIVGSRAIACGPTAARRRA